MGWGRTLLLGEIGNRLDIDDCADDIRVLKQSLMEMYQEGHEVDAELRTVQMENNQLKLYVAALIRLLTIKGVISTEDIKKMVDVIDAEDGAMDGKARGDVL